MGFGKKISKLQFLLDLKKQGLKGTNETIDSIKSSMFSFKKTKMNFMKKVDSLPSGDARRKGGNIMSKQMFVDAIATPFEKDQAKLLAGMQTAQALKFGPKGLKKLKKLRKKQVATIVKAEKEIKRIRFIRRNGRIIPIKVKK